MQIKLYRGKYYAVWRQDGQTKRLALRTEDRGVAKQRLEDLKLKPVAETIGQIIDAYFEDKKSLSSFPSMVEAWKSLEPHFAHLRPDQVNRLLCRSYTEHRRRQNIKDGTVIKELGVVRAGINWYTPNSPAQFEMPPQPAPKDRYLTRKEYSDLLEGCGAPHIRLFVILALSTAGRQSAILQLTWDRVDFDRGIIQLSIPDEHGRRKGRATVPMTNAARRALEEAKKAALTDFVIEYGEKPVMNIKKAFGRACERAKLKDVTPHTLRHTAAVWMAEAATPMSQIAQYLGHSNSLITERVYAKYSPEFLKGAASALDF
jgi:integrase